MTDIVSHGDLSFGGDADRVPLRTMAWKKAGALPLRLVDGRPAAPRNSGRRLIGLAIKRAMDIVLSSIALLVLAPLLLGVALAVKLTSPGKVLFRQPRPGLGGQPFEMLKFRTMHADACDVGGLRQAKGDDPRVTPIGRFLRATSIDELPQLWNILKGDMSIIGPRPMVEGMRAAGRDYRELVPYYDYRLTMKPGLSGWAQANGLRGPTDDEKTSVARIEYDAAYIQNFSVGLDLRIVLMTITREFLTGSGL